MNGAGEDRKPPASRRPGDNTTLILYRLFNNISIICQIRPARTSWPSDRRGPHWAIIPLRPTTSSLSSTYGAQNKDAAFYALLFYLFYSPSRDLPRSPMVHREKVNFLLSIVHTISQLLICSEHCVSNFAPNIKHTGPSNAGPFPIYNSRWLDIITTYNHLQADGTWLY